MKFFKTFKLLHRRTKSATFVPGPTGPQLLDYVYAVPNTRPSSLPAAGPGLADDRGHGSSLFEFVTSKFASQTLPANFNHLNGGDSRQSGGIWGGSKRRSARDSGPSILTMMENEHMRLREALNMWIHEHAKALEREKTAQLDLDAERQKTQALEHQARMDRQLILDLRQELSSCQTRLDELRDLKDLEYEHSSSYSVAPVPEPMANLPSTGPVAPSASEATVMSTKRRSLDEYSSALRMTLITRKQLREQRKISKFWKRTALVSGIIEDTVTPSTSAISSINEVLPDGRKAAVMALMERRGWPENLIQIPVPVESVPSFAPLPESAPSSMPDIPSTESILPSTSSKSSGFSRLEPLASDSLKAEMNLLFGVHGNRKRRSPPAKSKLNSESSNNTIFSKGSEQSISSGRQEPKEKDPSCSIQFYDDSGTMFTDSIDQNSSDNTASSFSQDLDFLPPNLSLASSPCLVDSTIPSGYSQTFCQVLKPSKSDQGRTQRTATSNPPQLAKISSLKIASKECTPRRSWQTYVTKSSTVNKPIGDSKHSTTKLPASSSRKTVNDKENKPSTPILRRRASRLPLPTPTKEWCY